MILRAVLILLIILFCFDVWALSGSSREFDGSNDELRRSSSILNGRPATMAAWFNSPLPGNNAVVVGESHTLHTTDYSIMILIDSGSPDVIRVNERSNTNNLYADTTDTLSTNTWHFSAVRFVSASERSISLDGGSRFTDTTTMTLLGAKNIVIIGFFERSSGKSSFFDGLISFACFWDVALDELQEDDLSNGYPPDWIEPNNLELYLPFAEFEDHSGNGNDLTNSGTVVSTDGPPIWIPMGAM